MPAGRFFAAARSWTPPAQWYPWTTTRTEGYRRQLMNYPVRSLAGEGSAMAGHRMSIATHCLSGTLEDKLAAAAAARFHGIELAESDLVATSWSPGRIREECARRGLTVEAYQPFPDFEAVPPDVFSANLRRAERTFAVLEKIGAKTVLVASSMSPEAVDDDDLAAEQLNA